MSQISKEDWGSMVLACGAGFKYQNPEAGFNRVVVKPELSALERALAPYFAEHPASPMDRAAVDDAVLALTSFPGWEKYRKLLRWVRTELDRASPRQLLNVCPMPFTQGVSQRLNALARFACTDWGQFTHHIPRAHRSSVISREKARTDEEIVAQQGLMAIGARPRYDLQQIQSGAAKTLAAESGCCTTFAMIAASILMEEANAKGIRVETVTFHKNMAHCFVIVGRESGGLMANGVIPYPGSVGDNYGRWGANCFIVDPWLGTLGNEVIYAPVSEYSEKGYLVDLKRTYSNVQGEVATCEVQARNSTTPLSNLGIAFRKTLKSVMKCPKCKSDALSAYSDMEIPDGLKCDQCGYKSFRKEFY